VCRDIPESEDELNNVETLGDCSYHADVVFSTTVDASYFLEISKYNRLARLPIITLRRQNSCVNECNRHHCSNLRQKNTFEILRRKNVVESGIAAILNLEGSTGGI
jgi:hypothetical protein